jgi:hypothetical protein
MKAAFEEDLNGTFELQLGTSVFESRWGKLTEYEHDSGSPSSTTSPTPPPLLPYTLTLTALLDHAFSDFEGDLEMIPELASDLADLLGESYNASVVTVDGLSALSPDDSGLKTLVSMTVEFPTEGTAISTHPCFTTQPCMAWEVSIHSPSTTAPLKIRLSRKRLNSVQASVCIDVRGF